MDIRSQTLHRATRRSVAALAAGVALATTLVAGAADAAPGLLTPPELVTAAATGALGADDAIACPIPAGSDFVDSWGASRSGGRRRRGAA